MMCVYDIESDGLRDRIVSKLFTNPPIRACYKVLEDVTELERSPDGVIKTSLDRVLLNGGNVCMLVPGSEGPEEAGEV